MAAAQYGSIPFREQIEFFQRKRLVTTQRWADLWREQHDAGFMVAGAMKTELVADFHTAILKAIEQGTTLAGFRKDFDRIVAAHGWTGWRGEDSKAGRAWRTRVIYETNLRTSYQAGRWAQVRRTKASRPYLQYKHSDYVTHPRPEHQAWDGLVLPVDHPWWQTHWPPNGWGCQCKAFALSERDLQRLGKSGPDQAPEDGERDWTDKVTGEVHRVPVGIDPGWDYAPGASRLQQLLGLSERQAARVPAALGAVAARGLAGGRLLEHRTNAFAAWADAVVRPENRIRIAGALSPAVIARLQALGSEPETAVIAVRDLDILHAHRDTKPDRLPWTWYRELPRHLAAIPVVVLDTHPGEQALLLVFDNIGGGAGRLVVRLDYQVTVRGKGRQKTQRRVNLVRSGSVLSAKEIAHMKNSRFFVVLDGSW